MLQPLAKILGPMRLPTRSAAKQDTIRNTMGIGRKRAQYVALAAVLAGLLLAGCCKITSGAVADLLAERCLTG